MLPFILCGCASETTPQNADEDIIALERSALDKWAQSNTEGYLEIAAEDVTWFDFTEGEQLRKEGHEEVRSFLAPLSGQIPPHTYEMVNPKVQVYGHSAILTFHWKGTMADGTELPLWKATSVYHWQDGKWSMVHGHWSGVQ